jgi:hypothetical protein
MQRKVCCPGYGYRTGLGRVGDRAGLGGAGNLNTNPPLPPGSPRLERRAVRLAAMARFSEDWTQCARGGQSKRQINHQGNLLEDIDASKNRFTPRRHCYQTQIRAKSHPSGFHPRQLVFPRPEATQSVSTWVQHTFRRPLQPPAAQLVHPRSLCATQLI